MIPPGDRPAVAGHSARRVHSDWQGSIWVNGFHSSRRLARSDVLNHSNVTAGPNRKQPRQRRAEVCSCLLS